MPSSVDPMLPTTVKLPFSDPQWLFEPKLDGFRALCFLKDGQVRFLSRNRRNLTKQFPEGSQYPLVARKEALRRILRRAPRGRIRYTEHVAEEGERLFTQLEEMQLEGMVCKRKDIVYAFARSKVWLKVKTASGRAQMQKRIETWGK